MSHYTKQQRRALITLPNVTNEYIQVQLNPSSRNRSGLSAETINTLSKPTKVRLVNIRTPTFGGIPVFALEIGPHIRQIDSDELIILNNELMPIEKEIILNAYSSHSKKK